MPSGWNSSWAEMWLKCRNKRVSYHQLWPNILSHFSNYDIRKRMLLGGSILFRHMVWYFKCQHWIFEFSEIFKSQSFCWSSEDPFENFKIIFEHSRIDPLRHIEEIDLNCDQDWKEMTSLMKSPWSKALYLPGKVCVSHQSINQMEE